MNPTKILGLFGASSMLIAMAGSAIAEIPAPTDKEILAALQLEMPEEWVVSKVETLAEETFGSSANPRHEIRVKVTSRVGSTLFVEDGVTRLHNLPVIKRVMNEGDEVELFGLVDAEPLGAGWDFLVDWDRGYEPKSVASPREAFADTAVVKRSPEFIKIEDEFHATRLEFLKKFAGEWTGSYHCGTSNPPIKATVKINLPEQWWDEEASFSNPSPFALVSTFDFEDTWSPKRFTDGAFEGRFSVDLDSRQGHFEGTEWIARPQGVGMVHPNFAVAGDELVMNLNIAGCSNAQLRRVAAPGEGTAAEQERIAEALAKFVLGEEISASFGLKGEQHSALFIPDEIREGFVGGSLHHAMISAVGTVVQDQRVVTRLEVLLSGSEANQFVHMKPLTRGEVPIPRRCQAKAEVLDDGRIMLVPGVRGNGCAGDVTLGE